MRTPLITPARRDAALLGVVVGAVAVLALTVAAVIGLTPHTPEAEKTTPHDTESGLHTALLEAEDLPASFSPGFERLVGVPVRTAAQSREKCAQLLADPVAVLRWLEPARDNTPGDKTTGDKTTGDKTAGDKTTGDKTTPDNATGDKTTGDTAITSARHVDADQGVLDQAVRVFDRGHGATAMDALRRRATQCKAFTAMLDDGTKAHVRITSADRGDLLIGDSYTVSMTLHTPSGEQDGYLAIGRVGDVVSVLRRTAPRGSDQGALDEQIQDLVGRAVGKIVDLGGLAAPPGAK